MTLVELFLIAVGLSMDAFAVSICKGLAAKKVLLKEALTVGLYFGLFQAVMPLLGYFLGSQFAGLIQAYDHWIAFVLLIVIGGKMIIGCFRNDDRENGAPGGDTLVGDTPACHPSLSSKEMFPLAIATSIDALAVGITFAFLNVSILPAVSFIGITTLLLSMLGFKLGHIVGGRFKAKAEFAGGVILCLMGLKILLEHTGIYSL